jgi:ABC-type sulfate/molybdate transport systems ATPase subunit
MIDARLLVDLKGFRLDLHLRSNAMITALFGASGAGKSLTLDCLAGFARPDQGRILIGDDILYDSGANVDMPPRLRRCGYVFQSDALFPHMTLRENLNFARAGHGRLERMRAVDEMLDRFHLAEHAGKKPNQLSGGQRQRGSIARALLAQPRILLLDEPSRGLDAALRREFYEAVREVRSMGVPAVLVTHDMDEALELGDDMVVIEGGRIIQHGAPFEVLDAPYSASVARLMACYNIAEAEIIELDPAAARCRLRCRFDGGAESDWAGPYIPGLLLGAKLDVAVRAEAVQVDRGGVPLRVRRTTVVSGGLRVEFDNGLVAVVGGQDVRNTYNVNIPPGAWRVLR